MTDLLTPDQVTEMLKHSVLDVPGRYRLLRDYITLWDRNKELEEELTELVHSIGHPLKTS